ncbi:hypothetical protein JAAARDRAFT_37634 [Jaapia argillacea MUCL 33604]|uniref:Uncharacterized protein n=1 Tax=Jaapia argillacea MUCL 33604 TaxID=933084 RepID=A0A067PXN8_9AGAM|nr:hypothetical protein JAAARDRAFT_37634 [Jaapia argillacea MUCL 33604]
MAALHALEPGSLYAVLNQRGELGSWHWSLFFSDPLRLQQASKLNNKADTTISTGTMYHALNDNPQRQWRFQIDPNRDVVHATQTVLIMKLVDLSYLGTHLEILTALENNMRDVPVEGSVLGRQEFSGRHWFLSAMKSLDEAGFVNCEDVDALEREVIGCALRATARWNVDVEGDKGWGYRWTYAVSQCCS